jgi:hypothetical protein
MYQWASFQLRIHAISSTAIGAISDLRADKITDGPMMDRLPLLPDRPLHRRGMFFNSSEYFTSVAEASYKKHVTDGGSAGEDKRDTRTAYAVFLDIIRNTKLFSSQPEERFAFHHTKLNPENIVVDDKFNIVSVTNWEYCHTVPWQAIHFPDLLAPFLAEEDLKRTLADPDDINHQRLWDENTTRNIYLHSLAAFEADLDLSGVILPWQMKDILESRASKIYARFMRLGINPKEDRTHVWEMTKLAYEFNETDALEYITQQENKLDAILKSQ